MKGFVALFFGLILLTVSEASAKLTPPPYTSSVPIEMRLRIPWEESMDTNVSFRSRECWKLTRMISYAHGRTVQEMFRFLSLARECETNWREFTRARIIRDPVVLQWVFPQGLPIR